MGAVIASLVKEITTAAFNGTGAVLLDGAVGTELWARTFVAGVGAGNTCEFLVRGSNGEWERSIGTVSAGSPDSLSRDIVVANHLGTTAKIDLTAGVKDVYLIGPRYLGRPSGECRLGITGGVVALDRHNGRLLFIDGVNHEIPVAGITLAATALSVDTNYFIYAYMNAGTMTLEASATARATDATYGHEIKSGDATRTLVGLARTVTGPAWVDNAQKRLARSWFNDPGVDLLGAELGGITTGSTSFAALGSSVEFLSWAGELVALTFAGTHTNNTIGSLVASAIGLDTAVPASPTCEFQPYGVNALGSFASSLARRDLSEGYHVANAIGAVGANTASWPTATPASSISSRLLGRAGG